MTVTLDKLKELVTQYRESLAAYEEGVDERYLEELEAGVEKNLAGARARHACNSLYQDVLIKAEALDNASLEYRFVGTS